MKYAVGPAGQTYGAEADGLAALRRAAQRAGVDDDIAVPSPLAQAAPTVYAPGYLVLPWLERGDAAPAGWTRFGEGLARLHQGSDDAVEGYGWTRDNFLGPEPQPNAPHTNWPDFFRERRLLAMAARMRARGRWRRDWDGPLEALSQKLDTLLPAAPPPALLHGDLWAGNAMALGGGRFALIDPAVYRGHHEVDLALAELFGGYPPAFADGYHGVTPRETGFAERRDLYQLYYLMMHLGISMSYGARVEAILRRYG